MPIIFEVDRLLEQMAGTDYEGQAKTAKNADFEVRGDIVATDFGKVQFGRTAPISQSNEVGARNLTNPRWNKKDLAEFAAKSLNVKPL